MQETNLKLVQTQIDKGERARRLAAAYAAILAWPDPQTTTEPVATDLGGNEATGSASETSVDPEAHFDSSTESVQAIELASGVDLINTSSRKEGTPI
jgi:hypothetical protein